MAILLHLLLAGAMPSALAAMTPRDSCPYTVVAGDYCYAIATSKFKITLGKFYELNPGKQANDCPIFPGDVLNGPCGVEPQQAPKATLDPKNCLEYYKVQSGDTCSDISVSKSVSLDYIKQWNGLTDACPLRPGQDLCVAAFPQTRCADGYMYTIKKGDICWDIAHGKGFDTTVSALTDLNRNLLGNGCIIFPKQKMCVRGATNAKRETAKQPDQPLEAVAEAGGVDVMKNFVGNRTDPAPIPKNELKEELKVALKELNTDGKPEEMTGMARELSEVKKAA